MQIYCHGREEKHSAIRFGVDTLKNTLQAKAIHASEQSLSMLLPGASEQGLAVRIAPDPARSGEGFSISRQGDFITVTGFGPVGAMYGLLDVEETVRLYGWDRIAPTLQEPFHKKRGIKFNLPFQPYADGEIFEKNNETVKSFAFWESYLEFLARNRYNCLSLWSENPFEYMTDIAKYPDASDLSAEERREYRRLFSKVFAKAKGLGIDVYIITWNLRISAGIAKGLGLPEELAKYHFHSRSIGLRQHSEVIQDYFREAVKTLFLTYPDLTGIGTSNSEELTGTPEAREQWVADAYLKGLEDLGYPVPFIHRTNMSNGVIAQEMFLSRYSGKEKYISWKYSNAHMYSHPSPQFEAIFDAWGSMDMEQVRVLYTVRNDDFHNLRGCDPDFLSEYIKGMKKPYVDGFYWGSDCYIWAGEHQHVPNHPHVEWEYSFEKHWMQHVIIGRLAYNPALPASLWNDQFIAIYGADDGATLYRGLCAGVRMLCAVNRLFWLNYDFHWHPESILGREGFKTIRDFMAAIPMPRVNVMGMREFVEHGVEAADNRETPPQIIATIQEQLDVLAESISRIDERGLAGEKECVFWDVKAWHALGSYYLRKFKATIALLRYERNGDEESKNEGVALLREAVAFWKELSLIGAQHYLPYKMARVELTFGWGFYLREVEQDVVWAESLLPIGSGGSGSKEYNPGEWSGF
jgi:hypothetical protein